MGHIVNINVVAEYLACVVVVGFDRCAGEADKCGIGEQLAHNGGKTKFEFAGGVVHLCFDVALRAVSFIAHHDYVRASCNGLSTVFELLNVGKDYAVAFALIEQFV